MTKKHLKLFTSIKEDISSCDRNRQTSLDMNKLAEYLTGAKEEKDTGLEMIIAYVDGFRGMQKAKNNRLEKENKELRGRVGILEQLFRNHFPNDKFA